MDCPSEEKMINFLTDEFDELREVMSQDEVETIRAHISQCAKCQKEKEKYLKLIEKIAKVGKEKKRIAPSMRKGNGEDLICSDEEEKIALLKEMLKRKEDER